MLHLIRSLTSQHQLFARPITASRLFFMTLQAAKAPLTSLNNAAALADLNLNGSLEEIAARHFSEPSIFPELTPMEDTLLYEAVVRIKMPKHFTDAHTMAAKELTLKMQPYFCEPSDFPEYTVVEEEIMLQARN
ncbi:unnamed protein product [Peronospora farinosa]|uniref:Uncharacterized protein n=1 Tax=Peronospora farinosa TaxID=134698 RepID=A0AAV0TQG2_9STRA|nr:unnamed protein product [Peronospora farinosa]CAI5723381.1 unnamed protein product [Peronospora farinosa]